MYLYFIEEKWQKHDRWGEWWLTGPKPQLACRPLRRRLNDVSTRHDNNELSELRGFVGKMHRNRHWLLHIRRFVGSRMSKRTVPPQGVDDRSRPDDRHTTTTTTTIVIIILIIADDEGRRRSHRHHLHSHDVERPFRFLRTDHGVKYIFLRPTPTPPKRNDPRQTFVSTCRMNNNILQQ